MSYLPWLAGGALAGYLHRKGAQGRRDVPFPMPPQLDLSSITLGAWTAVPVAAPKEDRWGGTTKLWNVVGPQKGFSLWRFWPKAWGFRTGVSHTVRLKKGNKWVGHIQVASAYREGGEFWVVEKSHLDEAYRGTGLGSLMYLAARNMIEAYKFKPVKMISTKDYGGSGTSPMAQKVWDRLRGEGRLSRGRRNIPFEGDYAHPADFGGLPWLYHHTSQANIPRIARHGLVGGDGRNWDDEELIRRSTGRVYFSTEEDRWAFGDSVPLRVRPQDVPCQYDHNWELMFGDEPGPDPFAYGPGDWKKHTDCYVTLAPHERISPRLIQIQGKFDRWVPLLEYAGLRGRRAQNSSFERDLASANVFLMDWVCDGWGKLPAKIQRIADKKGALTAAEKRALVQWFRDTAPGNYS